MIKTARGIIKLSINAGSCMARVISTFKKYAYVSPRAELKGAARLTLGQGAEVLGHSRIWANGKSARITIGDYTTIFPYALLKANGGTIEIGEGSTVNDYSVLYGDGNLYIGNDVHIAAHVTIIAAEHIYQKLGQPDFSIDMRKQGVRIEDSVWIGANAVILDGVVIGKGAVIGAGAVVTKSIEPYSVAVGVPARAIKKWK